MERKGERKGGGEEMEMDGMGNEGYEEEENDGKKVRTFALTCTTSTKHRTTLKKAISLFHNIVR